MILHAEEMDKKYWWWAVYNEANEIIDNSDSHFAEKYKNGNAARKAAECAAKKVHAAKND